MDLNQLIAKTFLKKMTELLISKESLHTLQQIAITSPEKEKAIVVKRDTLASVRGEP